MGVRRHIKDRKGVAVVCSHIRPSERLIEILMNRITESA